MRGHPFAGGEALLFGVAEVGRHLALPDAALLFKALLDGLFGVLYAAPWQVPSGGAVSSRSCSAA